MADSSYNSPVRSYGSPARSLKMLDRVYGSPVRSYCGDHSSATESESEDSSLDLLTEIPGSPDQTVIDGWLKFRDNKKVSGYVNILMIIIGKMIGHMLKITERSFVIIKIVRTKILFNRYFYTIMIIKLYNSVYILVWYSSSR